MCTEASALQTLAVQALALLSSEEEDRLDFSTDASLVADLLHEYDVSRTGQLEATEARQLFSEVALQLYREAAASGKGAAAAHAQALLESGDAPLRAAIDSVAELLLKIADADEDGVISLSELSQLFEGDGLTANATPLAARPSTLELYQLRGHLQLLPRIARHFDESERQGEAWHDNVAGDSHTLLRWVSPTHARDGLSIVGLGRSADASCYYLPEWGLVLDAGLSTKAFTPKTVLLSHGHRDHTQALPVLARPAPFGRAGRASPKPPKVLLPAPLEPLVRSFLYSESVLNYGQPQSEADNEAALGALDLHAVSDGDVVGLPRHCYAGPMRGLSVQVFAAPHKNMPAVAYGLFRYAKRLKPEYAAQQHRIAELVRASPGLEVSEKIKERLLFYSGDTTIGLLERSAEEVLQYRHVVHECTFCGPPSAELDEYAAKRGHTHYAQLHPFISASPDTIWILVHWSIKYSRDDVEEFFRENYGGVPRNVVLWI